MHPLASLPHTWHWVPREQVLGILHLYNGAVDSLNWGGMNYGAIMQSPTIKGMGLEAASGTCPVSMVESCLFWVSPNVIGVQR